MADKTNSHETFMFKFALSAVAAVVAESVTYPLDLTKTRLQIQGEQTHCHHAFTHQASEGVKEAASHRGMLKTAVGIVREEGLPKLWQGVTPALYRHVGRVKSTWHAFSSLRKEGGVRGLWRGCVPNVQRAALVNMGDLATYDTAKHFLLRHTSLQDNYVTHSLASGMSGIVAALVGTPADVVKTRIMNQPTKDGKGLLYTSSLNCAVKTVQNEGFLALYKGLLPIWARMAPWSLTFWLTYEKVRKTVGTSSF
ncbi:mitochondrial uncoupling protein 4-like [Lingula anatina]|uniref:Mitochondrial uncoupling protein 4-like n=1 Tax=Lingula anatina TaxID=7574 RepID=A0A1S3IJT6_LINAN|nr:mitochondrial uncoupling protein 4-like [Lingula anatina]|eukprot:XP_013398373.1 mitochondrial uncoupling protein 4-like [Lingula anatina]